jgi:DNA-binding NtrC family response regulator
VTVSALVLEDDRISREAVARLAEREGFEPLAAASLKEARAVLRETRPDVLVLDVELPDGSGLELLEELDDLPDADVVIVSGATSVDEAVYAMREGAVDVLGKPVDSKRLRRILASSRRTARLRGQIGELRGELKSLGRYGRLVGRSPAIEHVYDLVSKVASTDAAVLITGETGTGKEVVAESIHELSRRAERPFLPLNCGAVAPELVESELFGHERGSFTGATRRRKGVFEKADGGTLFLDEITEMSPELQVRLLRVLETQEVGRVGGDRPIAVDVRVVAATNRVPEDAVREGKLREDLLFRLNVFRITVPPLRNRGPDAELLARHFLEELNRAEGTNKEFSERAIRKIRRHSWPGNVRELKNAIERAFIVSPEEIGSRDLTLGPEEGTGAPGDLDVTVGLTIAEAERRLILATLDELDGDKKRAARMLGISLKTLYNRLNAYAEASGPRSDDRS